MEKALVGSYVAFPNEFQFEQWLFNFNYTFKKKYTNLVMRTLVTDFMFLQIFVGKNYWIVFDRNKLLQFSSEGLLINLFMPEFSFKHVLFAILMVRIFYDTFVAPSSSNIFNEVRIGELGKYFIAKFHVSIKIIE